jgi:hypothetical protein
MASTPPSESQEDMQKRMAHYIETKRYLDEPEVLPWYKKDLTEIKPHTGELFENYCHVPPAEVEMHIKKIVRLPPFLFQMHVDSQTAR